MASTYTSFQECTDNLDNNTATLFLIGIGQVQFLRRRHSKSIQLRQRQAGLNFVLELNECNSLSAGDHTHFLKPRALLLKNHRQHMLGAIVR